MLCLRRCMQSFAFSLPEKVGSSSSLPGLFSLKAFVLICRRRSQQGARLTQTPLSVNPQHYNIKVYGSHECSSRSSSAVAPIASLSPICLFFCLSNPPSSLSSLHQNRSALSATLQLPSSLSLHGGRLEAGYRLRTGCLFGHIFP